MDSPGPTRFELSRWMSVGALPVCIRAGLFVRRPSELEARLWAVETEGGALEDWMAEVRTG